MGGSAISLQSILKAKGAFFPSKGTMCLGGEKDTKESVPVLGVKTCEQDDITSEIRREEVSPPR